MVWQKNTSIGFMLLGSILLPAVILVLLGWLVVKEPGIGQFDAFARMEVRRLASPHFTTVMQIISFVGSGIALLILMVVAVYLLCRFHRAREAALLALTMAGSSLLSVVLKSTFHRPRSCRLFRRPPQFIQFSQRSRYELTLFLWDHCRDCFHVCAETAYAVGYRARRRIDHRNDRILPHIPGSALPERRDRWLLRRDCLGSFSGIAEQERFYVSRQS